MHTKLHCARLKQALSHWFLLTLYSSVPLCTASWPYERDFNGAGEKAGGSETGEETRPGAVFF